MLLKIVGFLWVMIMFQGVGWAYYTTVDNLSMSYVGSTDSAFRNGEIYYRQQVRIQNNSSQALFDVGLVWDSVYSGSKFSYNDANHRWERELILGNTNYGNHWVECFTYDPFEVENSPGVNTFLNMSSVSSATQADTTFDKASSSYLSTLELPVYWLGDLASGEESLMYVYFAQNVSQYSGGGWGVQPVFSTVANISAVPVPAAVFLMGSGLCMVGLCRFGRRHTG